MCNGITAFYPLLYMLDIHLGLLVSREYYHWKNGHGIEPFGLMNNESFDGKRSQGKMSMEN